jgi:hypothetical protein
LEWVDITSELEAIAATRWSTWAVTAFLGNRAVERPLRSFEAAGKGVLLNDWYRRQKSLALKNQITGASLKQVFDDLLTSSTHLCPATGKVQPDRWNPHEYWVQLMDTSTRQQRKKREIRVLRL